MSNVRRSLSVSLSILLSLCCFTTKIKAISFYCSANAYALPDTQDCYKALGAFPTADGAHRYFIEPQMRLQMPNLDWPKWADPRLPSDEQRVEQIPKYWSSGSCNFALLSYVEKGQRTVPISFTTWSDVFNSALQLVHNCLVMNQRGGAATVPGMAGKPTMTVFMWQNRANFEVSLAQYTNAAFPTGIDPSYPLAALDLGVVNGSAASILSWASNATLPVDTS